jgi:hypothetical protein
MRLLCVLFLVSCSTLCYGQSISQMDFAAFQQLRESSKTPAAEKLKEELRKHLNQTDVHDLPTMGKALSDVIFMLKLAMFPTAIVDWQTANVSKQCYDDSNLYLFSNIYGSLLLDVGPVLWAMQSKFQLYRALCSRK